MNTTAGSFALLGSIVPRDAHVAKRLRDAGAILLGKTNLCEWSHMRGKLPSGFSGRGGQASNPYVPLGDPCGSSAGSGIGGAIGLAAAALGTETDGSIICPSSFNNLVGIKPTVGLTSRAGGTLRLQPRVLLRPLTFGAQLFPSPPTRIPLDRWHVLSKMLRSFLPRSLGATRVTTTRLLSQKVCPTLRKL